MTTKIKELEEEIEEEKVKMWNADLKRREDILRRLPQERFEGKDKFFDRMENVLIKVKLKRAELKGLKEGIEIGRQETLAEFFAKFDQYACIKDDKWYLDFKKQKLGELWLQKLQELKDDNQN